MDTVQSIFAAAIAAGVFLVIVRLVGGVNELYATVDISDNLQKTTAAMLTVRNGEESLAYAAFFALPAAIAFGVLAWTFDLVSSWDAMSHLREHVDTTLSGKLTGYLSYVFFVLTYLPTAWEMFSARFARFNIFWVQVVAVALAVLDLFTDLPHTRLFMQPYYVLFVNEQNNYLLNIVYGAAYYVLFGLWWFLASYGFELLFVICAWSLIGFIFKSVGGFRRPQRI